MSPLSFYTTHPNGTHYEHPLKDGLSVGRHSSCDIQLTSAFLTDIYFRVRGQGDAFFLESRQPGDDPGREAPAATGLTCAGRDAVGVYVNGDKVVGRCGLVIGDQISTIGTPQAEHPVFVVGRTGHPPQAFTRPWWYLR